MRSSVQYSLVLPLIFIFLLRGFSAVAAAQGSGQPAPEGQVVTSAVVQKAMRDHVTEKSKESGGLYVVKDSRMGIEWRVKLQRIHDPVQGFEKGGRTIYFACADFKTDDGKNTLDVDLWLVDADGKLEVIDKKIHSINGQPRFTYEGTDLKPVP